MAHRKATAGIDEVCKAAEGLHLAADCPRKEQEALQQLILFGLDLQQAASRFW